MKRRDERLVVLSRILSDGLLMPDAVELVSAESELGAVLVWDFDAQSDGTTSTRTSQNSGPPYLLDDLAMVVESDDQAAAMVSLARKYGPMYLCKHGVPFTHNWNVIPSPRPAAELPREGLYPPLGCKPLGAEFLADWVSWVRRLLAAHRLMQSFRGGGVRQRPEDWEVVLSPFPEVESYRHLLSKPSNRRAGSVRTAEDLLWEIQWWMRMAGVSWSLGWSASGPHLSLSGVGVLGLALRQLALGISAGTDLNLRACKQCGAIFSGRSNKLYCGGSDCDRERARVRQAKRVARRRRGQEPSTNGS